MNSRPRISWWRRAIVFASLLAWNGCAAFGPPVVIRGSSEVIPIANGDIVELPPGWEKGFILSPEALVDLLRCCGEWKNRQAAGPDEENGVSPEFKREDARMTFQAVHTGNPTIYAGNDGRLTLKVRDRSSGLPVALTGTGLNVSRAVFHMAGRAVDSDVHPSAFEWTTGGATGDITVDLTGFDFPSGSFGARLVLYCLAHPNGLVVADGLPVNVEQALSGTIPSAADVNTLFATLASDAAGQGSDRVAWVGQSPARTVTEGLVGLAMEHSEHLSDTMTHGATGEVVGTMNGQILCNKTLASPTLDDPVVNVTGWTNANHDHSAANKGGAVGPGAVPKAALQSGCFATTEDQAAAAAIDVAVTPGRQQSHPSAAKGWVRFNGTGTLAVIASYNVAGVTDNGTGDYTVTWATDFSSSDYAVVVYVDPTVGGSPYNVERGPNINTQMFYALRVITPNPSGNPEDAAYVSIIAYGNP